MTDKMTLKEAICLASDELKEVAPAFVLTLQNREQFAVVRKTILLEVLRAAKCMAALIWMATVAEETGETLELIYDQPGPDLYRWFFEDDTGTVIVEDRDLLRVIEQMNDMMTQQEAD